MSADESPKPGGGGFPSTRTSLVLGALADDTELRKTSWEKLARAYDKPIYKYIRLRWRKDEEQARDLTQAFFARCLEKDTFAAYDRERARFRTFIRVCLDRFVSNEYRATRAQRRGGQLVQVSFDLTDAEAELADSSTDADPERTFEREWVRHVLSLAAEAFRADCSARGKTEHWDVFRRYHLEADEPPSYAELASAFGISVTDVTNRLSYARRTYRRIALDLLRDLTANEEEFRAEAATVLGVEI
jgi:RNA polymerase sigma factor (sigma-70 family)